MAFSVENNYKSTNSSEFFHKRTNPYANGSNIERLKIVKQYNNTPLEFVGDFVVAGGGATLTLTTAAPTNAYTTRYLNIQVIDQSGNKAGNAATGVVASLAVNTSGLNPADKWEVVADVSDTIDTFQDGDAETKIWFFVNDIPSNPTVSINTVLAGAQVLAITQADGSTVVADGGNYNIGSFAAGGTTEAFQIGLSNTGEHVLKITSATPAGDVTAITLGIGDSVVYPDQVILIDGLVDASGIAGAYSGTVTIASDDPANASYVITIDYTLV